MPEKVLIFDFDGVLADTFSDLLRFGEIMSNKLGLPVSPTADDLNALDQMGFAEFGRRLGLPEDKVEDFVQGSFDLFNQRQVPPKIFKGMDSVIEQLMTICTTRHTGLTRL
jgi:phosphoglycolate phosphatase-like HAD superfamily hydrolase